MAARVAILIAIFLLPLTIFAQLAPKHNDADPPPAPAANGSTISVARMKTPEKAQREIRKAEEYLQKGKNDDARRASLRALEIYPDCAEAHTFLGIIALREKRANDTIAELETAIRLDPNSPLPYILMGVTDNVLGRYDAALQVLSTAVRMAPKAWQIYFEMAHAAVGQGDFAAGLQHVDQALALVPAEMAPLHLLRGQILLQLKDYAHASGEFEQYLKEDPQGQAAPEARQALAQARGSLTGEQ
jgi:tetratricopeptide (TPR) repeat protein